MLLWSGIRLYHVLSDLGSGYILSTHLEIINNVVAMTEFHGGFIAEHPEGVTLNLWSLQQTLLTT